MMRQQPVMELSLGGEIVDVHWEESNPSWSNVLISTGEYLNA
jgi:hypothetical protein